MATSGQTNSSSYAPLEDVPKTSPPCKEQQNSDAAQHPNIIITLPPQTIPASTATTGPGIPGQNDRYNRKAGGITGASQICVGTITWICGIVFAVKVPEPIQYWLVVLICGWLFVVTGIRGVVARNGKTNYIVAYMVTCIISAMGSFFTMFCGLGFTSVGISELSDFNEFRLGVTNSFGILSIISGFAELIIAIIGSVYCCKGICVCCGTPPQTAVVVYTPSVPAVGQASDASPPPYTPQDSASQGQIPAKI